MENVDPFIVKDSKAVSIIASLVCFAMFFSAIGYNNFNANTPRTNTNIFYLTIIPAIFFLVHAFRNKIVIEVNKEGIFYYGSLLTNWSNFISADYKQEEIPGSLQDNFVLLIEYYKPETGMYYVSKIKLTGTLNKAEEDIIAAIKLFCPDCLK